MIDMTVPTGRQPEDLVRAALVDVFDRQTDMRDDPPKLGPSIEAAKDCAELDDQDGLERALLDVAVGAIASLVRVRACAS